MVDFNEAKLDPSRSFESPKEILSHSELSKDQKLELLKRWEYDAKLLELAEDENMAPTLPEDDLLDEVLQSIKLLETDSNA